MRRLSPLPLHYEREPFQFVLKDGQRAPCHFDAAGRIESGFGRYSISTPHQEHLQEFGSLAGIQKTSL
jgi:hypothetical protein